MNLTNINDATVPVPLNILNTLTIGARGQLQILNSSLQANTMVVSNTAILLFSLGTNSVPVAVATNLTLGGTLNVNNGGGLTSTTYTLFTYGGVLTYSGLTIGTTPTNSTCVVDTNTAGQVNLTVTLTSPPPSGSFRIISIVRSGDDIALTWTASSAGNNFVQATAGDGNGSYTNNFQDISGQIAVGAGTTNTYPDVGGATNAPSRFYRIRFPQ